MASRTLRIRSDRISLRRSFGAACALLFLFQAIFITFLPQHPAADADASSLLMAGFLCSSFAQAGGDQVSHDDPPSVPAQNHQCCVMCISGGRDAVIPALLPIFTIIVFAAQQISSIIPFVVDEGIKTFRPVRQVPWLSRTPPPHI